MKAKEVWFVTGSQHLYGPETLERVNAHSREIAESFSRDARIPVTVVFKPVLKTASEITALCAEANHHPSCVGIIAWMHTFSPAKMWIAGLSRLQKPLLHLHTQYNRDLPWSEIDMDFMNLNQSAHGDREFGFIGARLRLERKIVVGFWKETEVRSAIDVWSRAACAWDDCQGMKVARFGDNMREVAVTEGDKVEAQLRFGFSVNGYGLGDLVNVVHEVEEKDVERLLEEYESLYLMSDNLKRGGVQRQSLYEAARIEAGLRLFLQSGGFKAFTTTFEDLHGLAQLPGLAVQRLMAEGYGFGAEGDWKTAALVRAMKVMGHGLAGGTSFMEDYTYDFNPSGAKVLGAHMLEVCSSIASGKAKLAIHPLSIGGKADPARLVFDVAEGPALNATIIDLGNRFRMIVNEVSVVRPDFPLAKLPVARVVWKPVPDLKTAAAAWILAGGAHHTGFSQSVATEHLRDFARMAGIEFVLIDGKTDLEKLRNELRWNEIYYHLAKSF
jgi:L-arabinose isomerase